MAAFLNWLPTLLRRRKRNADLQAAAAWPVIPAKLLASKVVAKDVLAEEGSAFQTSQIEWAFYFTLDGNYYGGHVLSMPLSDSEAHRLLPKLAEDTPIRVRYNPDDPNQTHTLSSDNPEALPFVIWPS